MHGKPITTFLSQRSTSQNFPKRRRVELQSTPEAALEAHLSIHRSPPTSTPFAFPSNPTNGFVFDFKVSDDNSEVPDDSENGSSSQTSFHDDFYPFENWTNAAFFLWTTMYGPLSRDAIRALLHILKDGRFKKEHLRGAEYYTSKKMNEKIDVVFPSTVEKKRMAMNPLRGFKTRVLGDPELSAQFQVYRRMGSTIDDICDGSRFKSALSYSRGDDTFYVGDYVRIQQPLSEQKTMLIEEFFESDGSIFTHGRILDFQPDLLAPQQNQDCSSMECDVIASNIHVLRCEADSPGSEDEAQGCLKQ